MLSEGTQAERNKRVFSPIRALQLYSTILCVQFRVLADDGSWEKASGGGNLKKDRIVDQIVGNVQRR